MRRLTMVVALMGIAVPANAMYDTHSGRFLQHDPYGRVPRGGGQNPFEIGKQYTSSLNLYAFLLNNPELHLDPHGTNIYLSEDNHERSISDAFHQKVCVDKWSSRIIDGERCYVQSGKKCWYFGLVSWRRGPMGRTWLGWRRFKPPCGAIGKIAEDTDVGDGYSAEKIASVAEDRAWKNYMEAQRERLEDTYIPFLLDCRLYAQLEFGDAPGVLNEVVHDPSGLPDSRSGRVVCGNDVRIPPIWIVP